MQWASSAGNTDCRRRPVSADAARPSAIARAADPDAGPADGLASALLDAARMALNKERAMRQQVRGMKGRENASEKQHPLLTLATLMHYAS